MKFRTRVKNAVSAFGNNEKVENSLSNDAADFLRYGNKNKPLLQSWSQVEMSDQDMYTGYGYASIERRAERVSVLGKKFLFTEASEPIMAQAKAAGTEVEHPYLKIIRESKDFTQKKFWHDISTYLDLEGIYYLMAVRAVGKYSDGSAKVGAVQRFVMLNPYNVRRVIRESDGTIGGYVENRGGLYREIPPEMIIEIRKLNPFNEDEPFSMSDAAKDSQFTMKQASDYTRHSIQGNVNAPGILSTDVVLDDAIFDNFVSHVKNHEQGEPLYSNGTGGINWQSMQIDLDKAALDKVNEIHRQTLMAVSGAGKSVLSLEESGVTRDTSKTMKDNFTENAAMPQLEDIVDALNLDYRQWYPEWEKEQYEIVVDNPLESDREAELKDIEIREKEHDMVVVLVNEGYEYELAAKYAHGEISLLELGEPTLEPQLTDQQIQDLAAQQVGLPPSGGPTGGEDPNNPSQPTNDPNAPSGTGANNAVVKKNSATGTERKINALTPVKMVKPEENEKRLKDALVEAKKQKKIFDQEQKKAETPKEAKKPAEDEEVELPETKEDKSVPTVKLEITTPQNNVRVKATNQIAARDYPDLYEGLNIDPRALSNTDFMGCIMMNTEKIPVMQYIKNGAQDLVESERPEDHTMGAVSEIEPHTTLLFGLLNNGNMWKDKVDMLLKGWEMPSVTINEVSYFDLGDSYAIIGLLEMTPEIVDGHERLTLLPHVNTFSEYHPHITLAYIKHDVDPMTWVTPLAKKYNGQKVATTGLNYGDPLIESDDDTGVDNSLEEKEANATPETMSFDHNCADHGLVENALFEKINNELDPSIKDEVGAQEASLQNAIAKLDGDIANKVMEALQNGDIKKAEDIVSNAQEESIVGELAVILAAYYTFMLPIYAGKLIANRATEFNTQGVFSMTDAVKRYIDNAARKAAESHYKTVLNDLYNAYKEAADKATREELVKVIEEKANAREEKYVKKLPENPNREDIKKAVDDGKFDKDPAYKLARELALQGKGFSDISRKIQEEYNHVSTTRAKTIARNEASRAFNISQYQADVQFLNDSGLMDRAYKRLYSRTGDPCPVCHMLIEKTKAHPIPFKNNFASLGEVLTATYKKPNGSTAVQKVPINYESIKSGNVHVNCNCEYQLVVKDENGKFINSIDLQATNSSQPVIS